jgi:hypothetical protein
MPLPLVVVLSTNLAASELVALVKAVDSLCLMLATNPTRNGTGQTYVESAHNRFKLDVHHAVLVGFVELNLLDRTKLYIVSHKS